MRIEQEDKKPYQPSEEELAKAELMLSDDRLRSGIYDCVPSDAAATDKREEILKGEYSGYLIPPGAMLRLDNSIKVEGGKVMAERQVFKFRDGETQIRYRKDVLNEGEGKLNNPNRPNKDFQHMVYETEYQNVEVPIEEAIFSFDFDEKKIQHYIDVLETAKHKIQQERQKVLALKEEKENK